MRSAIAAAVAASALLGSGASAGEVDFYEDDDGPGEGYVEVAPPPVILPPPVAVRPPPYDYAPPVYGWIYAPPPNCGTYHYWNGDYCADARDEPPPSAFDPD